MGTEGRSTLSKQHQLKRFSSSKMESKLFISVLICVMVIIEARTIKNKAIKRQESDASNNFLQSVSSYVQQRDAQDQSLKEVAESIKEAVDSAKEAIEANGRVVNKGLTDLTKALSVMVLPIRLAGTNSSRSGDGRVEVYHNNEWGTVCDDNFDDFDAAVVCRTLGYIGGVRTGVDNTHPYGEGSGKVWLQRIGCSGSESTLLQCPLIWQPDDDTYCKSYESAAVDCTWW